MFYFIDSMTEADISAAQAIERDSGNLCWSETLYRRELSDPTTSRYLVAGMSSTLPPPRSQQQHPHLLRGLLPCFFVPTDHESQPSRYAIVGYAGLWLAVDEGHITTITVAPSWRGRGIGELLLCGLIDQAIDLHAAMLTLEVRISNHVAQRLYLKYGFRPAGKRPRYYTDNNEDALIMWTERITGPEYQQRLTRLRAELIARLRMQATHPHALPA